MLLGVLRRLFVIARLGQQLALTDKNHTRRPSYAHVGQTIRLQEK